MSLAIVRENVVATVPEPGVYPGVPWATYHAWDACSASRLSRLARSPRHLRAHLGGQVDDETAAKTSGRLLHIAVLEPERFHATVARGPEGDGRTRAVRDARAALEAGGKTVVAAAEYDRITAMRDQLLEHPTVRRAVRAQHPHRRRMDREMERRAERGPRKHQRRPERRHEARGRRVGHWEMSLRFRGGLGAGSRRRAVPRAHEEGTVFRWTRPSCPHPCCPRQPLATDPLVHRVRQRRTAAASAHD